MKYILVILSLLLIHSTFATVSSFSYIGSVANIANNGTICTDVSCFRFPTQDIAIASPSFGYYPNETITDIQDSQNYMYLQFNSVSFNLEGGAEKVDLNNAIYNTYVDEIINNAENNVTGTGISLQYMGETKNVNYTITIDSYLILNDTAVFKVGNHSDYKWDENDAIINWNIDASFSENSNFQNITIDFNYLKAFNSSEDAIDDPTVYVGYFGEGASGDNSSTSAAEGLDYTTEAQSIDGYPNATDDDDDSGGYAVKTAVNITDATFSNLDSPAFYVPTLFQATYENTTLNNNGIMAGNSVSLENNATSIVLHFNNHGDSTVHAFFSTGLHIEDDEGDSGSNDDGDDGTGAGVYIAIVAVIILVVIVIVAAIAGVVGWFVYQKKKRSLSGYDEI